MRPPDDTAKILSCFPGPVTLYPSRSKLFGHFLVSAACVAAGLWILVSNPASPFGLVLFGGGMLIAAGMMLPGASSLKLDREGFEITRVYRHSSILWKNASNFEAWRSDGLMGIGPKIGPGIVMFDSSDAKKLALGKLNAALMGHNAAIPETHGFSAEALADLMAQWRERAVTFQ